MKKLTALFSVLALAGAVSVANADILTLPDSGNFDTASQVVFFDFPPNASGSTIESINSISIDLTHTWAADVVITLAGPAGANFVLANGGGGSADLNGTYTFVQSGSGNGTLGSSGVAAGSYDAFTWTDGPFPKQGWVLNFQDLFTAADTGTWGNITIDFNKSTVIPEPTSALVLFGAAALAVVRRRR